MAFCGHISTHACLPPGPPFSPQYGGIDTQIAFYGFSGGWIPDNSLRTERTGVDAQPAAVAFGFIDHSDIPVRDIDMERTRRTNPYTLRIDALPALDDFNIVRPVIEDILQNLNSGQREIGFTFMHQRTGHHAALAALTFLTVDQQIAPGRRNIQWFPFSDIVPVTAPFLCQCIRDRAKSG